MSPVPVILFAYARPEHLRRTLDCLQANKVPLIYAFSDGPRTPDKAPAVARVREMLRAIDWCEVRLCERETNLGLGRSILAGVTEVLGKHETVIVFEDDLICVPGTYQYLRAALEQYRGDPRVMSVTEWTHPRVTPPDVGDKPYFDGRAECWVWGTWARAWRGMERDAKTLMNECEAKGVDIYRYGADLPEMAERELRSNIWAVRWLYWHILNHGLCVRPPWSMVEHIGFDSEGTNVKQESWMRNPPLKPCPPIPMQWPEPLEHPACPSLWQEECGRNVSVAQPLAFCERIKLDLRKTAVRLTGSRRFETMTIREFIKLFIPPALVHGVRRLRRRIHRNQPAGAGRQPKRGLELVGDYPSWEAAMADSIGYDDDVILEKTKAALLKVKNGEALYERDSLVFDEIQYAWPMLAGLLWVAARSGGCLNVLDFGGSLGSTYFQNRAFFSGLREVRWNIVEQARHVEVGRRLFEDKKLRFYDSPSACLAETRPQVILLSGVLQYLPDPYATLDQLSNLPCEHVIIDRTPFWVGQKDWLCVQHTPEDIYSARYPSWIFSTARFLAWMKCEWLQVADFDDQDKMPGPVDFRYRGMILIRKG